MRNCWPHTAGSHDATPMRILCLADLHYRESWFDWMIAQSTSFDLTCVAGDLLYDPQTFGASPALPDWSGGRTPGVRLQADQLRSKLGAAAETGRMGRVALCSGNHDAPVLWQSLAEVAGNGLMLLDSACEDVGGWLVSCLPYELRGNAFRGRWRTDHVKAAGQPWLVLCHVGPEGSRLMAGAREEQPVRELLATCPPSVMICGHIHRAAFQHEGAWAERIGATWCLNPGAQECPEESAAFPPHIVIDTGCGTLSWHHAERAPRQPQELSLDGLLA